MGRPLIDTGVLVALLDAKDEYHDWAKVAIRRQAEGFETCEAVVTEVLYHVRTSERAKRAVIAMIESGWLHVVPVLPRNLVAIAHCLEKFHPRADYADACLLALHENSGAVVWTCDRTDFTLYRTRAGEAVALKMPPV